MDMATIINDIIGFIESFIAELQKFFDSIKKNPGYENPENYPDNFPKK